MQGGVTVLIFGMSRIVPGFLGLMAVITYSIGYPFYGVALGMFAGIIGSGVLMLEAFLFSSVNKFVSAKINRLNVLLVFTEERKWQVLLGKFKAGWNYINGELMYLISSHDDVGFLDGIPLFIGVRGVGKTINTRLFVDFKALEHLLGEEVMIKIRNALMGVKDDPEEEIMEVVEEIKEKLAPEEVAKSEA